MLKSLFILIFSFSLLAKEWKTIYPLEHCNKVPLNFIEHNDGYKVKILKNNGSTLIATEIADLNDLSDLTEALNEASFEHCTPTTPNLYFDFGNSTCSEGKRNYTEAYASLFKNISNVIKKNNNSICSNYIPYLQLQDEILNIKDIETLEPEKSKSFGKQFLKIFTGKKTDRLIDHYDSCGGKKGSSKFIENIILLELKNSCITPKPEGIITWRDAQKIAEEISLPYSGLEILEINSKKSEIEKTVINKMIDHLINKDLSNILMPFLKGKDKQKEFDTFVNSLDAHKNLKKTKVKNLKDYVSNVYAVDLSIEIGEKSLPILIKSTFKEKLPSSWSLAKKENFINNNIINQAQENYNQCLAKEKAYIRYSSNDISDEKKIEERANLKSKYCEKNPKDCDPSLTCRETTTNLLTDQKGSKDTDKIKACIIESLTLSAKPLLKVTIANQKEAFKEHFNLTDELVNQYTDEAWTDLTNCLNKKIRNESKTEESVDIFQDRKWLEAIKIESYKNHALSCASKTEDNVSETFIKKLLLENRTLATTFSERPKKSRLKSQKSLKLNSELIAKVSEITQSSYKECLSYQYKLQIDNPNFKKTASLCARPVEIKAATEVIERKIQDMNKDNDSQINLKIKEFRSCGNLAVKNSINNIGNDKSSTPITSSEDSDSYLKKNDDLFNCVQKSAGDIAFVIAEKELVKLHREKKSELQDPKYLLSLKKFAANETRSCVKKELLSKSKNKEGKWRGLNKANENGSLVKIQDICKNNIIAKISPKILRREATLKLRPLIDQGFIKDENEIKSILGSNLSIEKDIRKSLKQKKSPEEVINQLKEKIEKDTISRTHGHLNQKIADTVFNQNFDSQCLYDIYKLMTKVPSTEKKSDMTLDQLAEFISTGLDFYKGKKSPAYKDYLRGIKKECQEFEKFKTKEDFYKSEFAKLIIKGQIYKKFSEEFKSAVLGNMDNKIKTLTPPHLDIKMIHANKMKDELNVFFKKHLSQNAVNRQLFEGDTEIIDLTTSNIESILSKDQKVLTKITKKILTRMFEKESGPGSFSDDFTKIQIHGNFGISGIETTYSKASLGKSFDLGSIDLKVTQVELPKVTVGEAAGAQASIDFFKEPQNIETVIDWEKIPQKTKDRMKTSILHNSILEAVNKREYSPSTSKKIKNIYKDSDTIYKSVYPTDDLEQMIDLIQYRAPKDMNDYESFIEKEAQKLTTSTLKKYPQMKSKLSKKELKNYIITEVKRLHLENNVSSLLINTDHSGQGTIVEKLTKKVGDRASEIWFPFSINNKEQAEVPKK